MLSSKSIAKIYGTRDAIYAAMPFVTGSVLDFGAGKGKYRNLLLEKAKDYVSFDMQPGADIIGDVLDPPELLLSRTFDTVICTQVLEHVRKPWVLVANIAKLTKKDGYCILTAPFMIPFHADPGDYFRYSVQGMRTLFEDAGFSVEICAPYGGIFCSMGETLKQKWFSPYATKRPSRPKRFVWSMIEHLLRILNAACPPGIYYANVICIAKKV